MKRKLLVLSGLLAISATPAFSQINWDNAPAIPGPEGTKTVTTHKVGIGLTVVPLDADLHINTAEYMNAPGTSDVNLRLTRNKIGLNMGTPHTSGHIIEAITNFGMSSTKGFVLTSDFNVGIGIDAPIDRLDVRDGGIALTDINDGKNRNIYGTTQKKLLGIYANTDGKDGPGIDLHGKSYTSEPGSIKFTSHDRNGKFVFGKWQPATSTLERHVVIDEVGDINMVRWHNDGDARRIMANSFQSGLQLFANSNSTNGAGIELYSTATPSYMGSIHFITHENGDPNADGFDFVNYTAPNWGSRFKIAKNGNLWLNGFDNDLTVNGNLNRGRVCYNGGTNSTDGPAIEMIGVNNGTYSPGSLMFVANTTNSAHNVSYNLQTYDGTNFDSRMRVYKDGKVAIGTPGMNTPNGYKLFVEEGILTERVKVAVMNSSNWMDCVFDDDYELKSLEQVEAYIAANNHLPDVPSAEEMVQNGLDVATMDATLLQKVEELTLYVIELKKQNDAQTKQINELRSKIK